MGRRTGLRMGLRGKPAILLFGVVGMIVIIGIYFTRSSSPQRSSLHSSHDHHGHEHGHKKSFRIGDQGNFDVKKFVRDNKLTNVRKPAVAQQNDNPIMSDTYKNVNQKFKNIDLDAEIAKADNSDKDIENSPLRNKPKFVEKNPNSIGNKIQTAPKYVEQDIPTTNEFLNLYQKPNPDQSELFRKMKHIVHLDLKGATPKLEYFQKLFPLLSSMGATGLLIEYEDMFPYEGDLSAVSSGYAFTKSTLNSLHSFAKVNKLEIIPLVQAFGHMEFVLKLEKYVNLRESSETPQIITPALNESYVLLETMLDQVLALHPASTHIHLGCDEVYNLGRGLSMKYMEEKGYDKPQMFFEHISRLVKYLKKKYPRITPIIWDDEFRHAPIETVKKFGMGHNLEPMIWSYTPDPRKKFSDDIWKKYGMAFKNVWAASSFKGATGSSQYYTNIAHHLSNHLGWIDVILEAKKIAPSMKFRGVAMTGWQRYDHFATLCELLPSAIPSLSMCLSAIVDGGFSQVQHLNVKKRLGCTDDNLHDNCTFPGHDMYELFLKFKIQEDKLKNNEGLQGRISGWLTDYNVKHSFGSPGQLNVLNRKLNESISDYKLIRKEINSTLMKYYDDPTVSEEWISLHVDQPMKYLSKKLAVSKNLMNHKIWPKRPLRLKEKTSSYNKVNSNNLNNFNQNFNPSGNKLQGFRNVQAPKINGMQNQLNIPNRQKFNPQFFPQQNRVANTGNIQNIHPNLNSDGIIRNKVFDNEPSNLNNFRAPQNFQSPQNVQSLKFPKKSKRNRFKYNVQRARQPGSI